jgi:hypothetical protein
VYTKKRKQNVGSLNSFMILFERMFMTMDVAPVKTSSSSGTGSAQEQQPKDIILDQKTMEAFKIMFGRRPKSEQKPEEFKFGSAPKAV